MDKYDKIILVVTLIGLAIFAIGVKYAGYFEPESICVRQAIIYQTEYKRDVGFFKDESCQYKLGDSWVRGYEYEDWLYLSRIAGDR